MRQKIPKRCAEVLVSCKMFALLSLRPKTYCCHWVEDWPRMFPLRIGSRYSDQISKNIVKEHMKECKDPDLDDNVEDCAYCRKYFSSVENFKKQQEETLFIWWMCGKCMTQDSPKLEFCAAMQSDIYEEPLLDRSLKLNSESCSDCYLKFM